MQLRGAEESKSKPPLSDTNTVSSQYTCAQVHSCAALDSTDLQKISGEPAESVKELVRQPLAAMKTASDRASQADR